MKPKELRAHLFALIHRHDRANPITSRRLGALTSTDPRKVRAMIQTMVLDGQLIGALPAGTASGLHGPRSRPGYFPIRSAADLAAVRNVLKSRLNLIAQRDRALLRAWKKTTGHVLQPLLTRWEAPQ